MKLCMHLNANKGRHNTKPYVVVVLRAIVSQSTYVLIKKSKLDKITSYDNKKQLIDELIHYIRHIDLVIGVL